MLSSLSEKMLIKNQTCATKVKGSFSQMVDSFSRTTSSNTSISTRKILDILRKEMEHKCNRQEHFQVSDGQETDGQDTDGQDNDGQEAEPTQVLGYSVTNETMKGNKFIGIVILGCIVSVVLIAVVMFSIKTKKKVSLKKPSSRRNKETENFLPSTNIALHA